MTDQSEEFAQILGLENAASGETAGESSLQKIFNLAADTHRAARFLRLGGPRQFRSDIIAIVDETGKSLTPGYRMLLDTNIPEIEFILTNPFSESFLSRMDSEKKPNWEIWRVKEQVLEFTSGLIRASQQRVSRSLSEIKIAFHSMDLVWNLGIVDGYYVVVRAYFKSASGHDDNIAELHLRPNSPSRLAESLISYYNAVKEDAHTDFIRTEKELDSIGQWPSLFKGNAILYPSGPADEWIEKACSSKFGDRAEVAWLSYEGESPKCNYFNPVKLSRRKPIDTPWKGETSCIHRIEGIPANDMLWHIQKIGIQYPDIIPQLKQLSGSILYQAFRALEEFRQVGDQNEAFRKELQVYPWAHQLENALREAGRFVIDNQRELMKCREEAKKLGRALEAHANVPFRDAHLKNRIIAIDRDLLIDHYEGFYQWLKGAEPAEIFVRLREATHDIDFETCFWKVSPWDDPWHVLWSNHLGFDHVKELANHAALLKTWWALPASRADETVMWMTLLCRSLREYSRRLWYDHIMPNTYQQRYSIERRDHFLDLALLAAEKIDGYTALKNFLDRCKQAGSTIWNQAQMVEPVEPVVAEFPSFVDRSPEIGAFSNPSPLDNQLVPQHGSTGPLGGGDKTKRSTRKKPRPAEKFQTHSILFLAADPTNISRLRLGEEVREIQEKIQLARLRNRFKLNQRMSVRPSDVSQVLLDTQPNIVHFSGHGWSTGELCFENQAGEVKPVPPEAIAALFEQFSDHVKCVVLNACYSEAQALAISRHIDYVIGMNQSIDDKAAVAFSVGFYQALGAGRTYEEAFKLGCVQIGMQDISENKIPVLIKKGQG